MDSHKCRCARIVMPLTQRFSQDFMGFDNDFGISSKILAEFGLFKISSRICASFSKILRFLVISQGILTGRRFQQVADPST